MDTLHKDQPREHGVAVSLSGPAIVVTLLLKVAAGRSAAINDRRGNAAHSNLYRRRQIAGRRRLVVGSRNGAESCQVLADIFVRSGGSRRVVVLLHGYAETSDSTPSAMQACHTSSGGPINSIP